MSEIKDLQFGACAWSLDFFPPNDVESFTTTAKQIAALPFPQPAKVIETFASMGGEEHQASLSAAREMKKVAGDLGLRVIACGFNPLFLDKEGKIPSPHLTSPDKGERERAIDRVKRGIEYAAAIAGEGKGILSGPWQARHKHLYPVREGEHDLLVNILRDKIAPYAKSCGVVAAFEPLRSHESCLVMPGDESLNIVGGVNHDNIGVNGDTVHWATNAEGPLVESLAKLAGSGYLVDFHLSEHDRKRWGTGDIGVRTKDILHALKNAGYKGSVVLENFCPLLHPLLDIHRPDRDSSGNVKTPYEVLIHGAQFISNQLSN